MSAALGPGSMECAEDTHFDPLSAYPSEHGAGGTAEQAVEQWPMVVEERPQLLQALDLPLRQKKRAWGQFGEAQQ